MDREEAIKILKDTLYDEKTPTDYLEAVKMGREALENQKTGHWKSTTHYARPYRVCSVCGCEREDDHSTGWNYCPNCGAKMERE